MILPPLDRLTDRFLAYSRAFLQGAGEDLENVQLKIDHSLRVLELSQEITARESITGPVAALCHAAALVHDTGRFPQYAKFGSFSDATTENHARLGLHALVRSGPGRALLEGCSPRARGVILGAVFLHNVRTLDKPLSQPLDTVVRVVRDSDKLDILPVLLSYLDDDGRPANKVVTLGTRQEPDAYSPELVEQVMVRGIVDYRRMRYGNDFKLLTVSWVYGLEFPTSARLLRERGHLQAILDSLPATPDLDRMRGQVLADLDRFCDKSNS